MCCRFLVRHHDNFAWGWRVCVCCLSSFHSLLWVFLSHCVCVCEFFPLLFTSHWMLCSKASTCYHLNVNSQANCHNRFILCNQMYLSELWGKHIVFAFLMEFSTFACFVQISEECQWNVYGIGLCLSFGAPYIFFCLWRIYVHKHP